MVIPGLRSDERQIPSLWLAGLVLCCSHSSQVCQIPLLPLENVVVITQIGVRRLRASTFHFRGVTCTVHSQGCQRPEDSSI